jgi:hypothetical protein
MSDPTHRRFDDDDLTQRTASFELSKKISAWASF